MTAPRKRKTTKPKPTTRAVSRVVAIIRVSKVGGRKGEKFMSPAIQREIIEAWAKFNSVEIIEWVVEADKSGKTTERSGLLGAMDRVRAGEADGLIVAKVDRFARSLNEGMQAVAEIAEMGGTFIAVNDGMSNDANSSPTQQMMLGILFTVAQWVLDTLTVQWDDIVTRHIAAGIPHTCPFGYVKNDDRRLVADPKTASWVVHVFERRAAKVSLVKIADELTAAGVETPRGGERWTFNQIANMLENRTYLGEIRSGEHENLAAVAKPIISASLWAKAHAITPTPRRERSAFLLSGYVRCGSCGGRMSGCLERISPERSKTKAEYTIPYYRCRRRFSWGLCDRPTKVRADHLDELVRASYVEDFIDTYELQPRAAVGYVDEAQAAFAEADAELDAWLDVKLGKLDDDEREKWQLGTDQRRSARRVAARALEQAKAKQIGAEMPADARALWESDNLNAQHDLIGCVYPVIVVWPTNQPRLTPVYDRTEIFRPSKLPNVLLPGRGVWDSRLTPIPMPSRIAQNLAATY